MNVPSIVKMCSWMEVSRSGFYEWRKAPESATAKRRGMLALLIAKSFYDSNETYGYRRVHADLAAWGAAAGPELVRSVMRELDLVPCQPKPWRFSLTEGDGEEHDTPDLVNRDFTAGKPGEKMVGDITYISTWAGWVYLATVIDCYTKAVVGWAIDDNYKTPLIQRAIEMAARNHSLADKAIFHTDRGSNYMSGEFARTLKKLNVRHSVGRTGMLRQCNGRVIQRGTEERTGPPNPVSDTGTRAPGHCEVHRILVQFETSALRTSVPDPAASPR